MISTDVTCASLIILVNSVKHCKMRNISLIYIPGDQIRQQAGGRAEWRAQNALFEYCPDQDLHMTISLSELSEYY